MVFGFEVEWVVGSAAVQPNGYQAVERHSVLPREASPSGSAMQRAAHQVQCQDVERQEDHHCRQEEGSWKVDRQA